MGGSLSLNVRQLPVMFDPRGFWKEEEALGR